MSRGLHWLDREQYRTIFKQKRLGLHQLDIQSNLHKSNLNNTGHDLNDIEHSLSWIQDTRGYKTVCASFERMIQINLKPPSFSWIQVVDGDSDRYLFLPVRDQGTIEKVLQVGLGDQ